MSKLPLTPSIQPLANKAGTAGINSNAGFNVSLTPGLQGMGGLISTAMGTSASRKFILNTTMQYPSDDGSGSLRTHNGCDDFIWCKKPCSCTFGLAPIVHTVGGEYSDTSSQEFPGVDEELDDQINVDGDYPIMACNQIGDINGDGLYDWYDVGSIATLILLHETEGYIANPGEVQQCDMDGDGQLTIADLSLHIDCLINDTCSDITEETHIEVEQNSTGIEAVEAAGSLGTFNVVYLDLSCPANANVLDQVLPTTACSESYVVYHIPGNTHYDANAGLANNKAHITMIICEPTGDEICTFNNISSANLQIKNFNTSNRSGLATTVENNSIISHNQSN